MKSSPSRIPPTASGGTFTLTFSGQTTADIAYDASAGDVQTALEALSNVSPGDVIVTGSAGGPWTVEFDQAYGGINVPLMIGNGSGLTGSATVSIQTTTEGEEGTNEVQQIQYTGPNFGASTSISLFDPISGAVQGIGTNGNWTQSLMQLAFNNALGFLGTGGTCTVTLVASRTFQIEFHGTWSGLNVPQMAANPSDPTTRATRRLRPSQKAMPPGRTRSSAWLSCMVRPAAHSR